MARSHADRERAIRRRVTQARAGDQHAQAMVERHALADLEFLLGQLDQTRLVARMHAALADALRAVARGNPSQAVTILAGVFQRSELLDDAE